jgi:hypothetical protein
MGGGGGRITPGLLSAEVPLASASLLDGAGAPAHPAIAAIAAPAKRKNAENE